jgi:hypothetical protein
MVVSSPCRRVGTPARDGCAARVKGGASRGARGVGVVRARASAGSAEREQFRMRFVVVFFECVRRSRRAQRVE